MTLSKREALAGMVMQAMITNPSPSSAVSVHDMPRVIASNAVVYADALIAELERTSSLHD